MKVLLTGLAALVLAVLVLGGCTASPEPPLTAVPGAYLGQAIGSEVFLAVVPGDNNTVRVYACDGKDLSNASVDQWFQGTLDSTGSVTLSAGAYKLTLRKADGAFSGEFFISGQPFPFAASLPTDGSVLLDAELRDASTGVVTRDGNVIVLGAEQRGNMVPVRKPRCRVVLVTASGGGTSYVTVC